MEMNIFNLNDKDSTFGKRYHYISNSSTLTEYIYHLRYAKAVMLP